MLKQSVRQLSKLDIDRRSTRRSGPNSDPLTQKKKFGGRISGLESQLVQAQEDLRLLKEELATKKLAQEELHKKRYKKPAIVEESKPNSLYNVPENESQEKTKKTKNDELASKEYQINVLKARLYDIEKDNVTLGNENESLRNQLKKTDSEMSMAKTKEDEIASKMTRIKEEIEESDENRTKLKKKLESMEEAKERLEAEMNKLKIQTEECMKATDSAAMILSTRCGSKEKHFEGKFVESNVIDDDRDDELESGKRRGLGMKMFGDLWNKKGQK